MSVQRRLVEISAVDVEILGHPVLQKVDLEVDPGEIVSLIGPNGAGKTTLVRVVLGLLQPAHGRVWRRSGMRIGYVPQRLALDPVLPLTVRRFLSLGVRTERQDQEEVLGEVGVPHLLGRSLHQVSGGELQRVLLARALLRRPDLLVLDEPVQGVDMNGQSEIYRVIARIRDERGCGILLVSHDLHLVMAATDKVVCLNHHVCCAGLPDAVSRHPEYVALFGSRVADDLALYRHRHDHVHDDSGGVRPLPEAHAGSGHRHG